MRKRRSLLLTFLVLLFVVGIPTGLLMREYRREQASRDLIDAILSDETDEALSALNAGADANARYRDDEPSTQRERWLHIVDRMLHPSMKDVSDDDAPSALSLIFGPDMVDGGHNPENAVLVQALLEHGANPDLGLYSSRSLLTRATVYGYSTTLRLLLEHKADVNQHDIGGWTPLHNAACSDNLEPIRLLLAYGADINAHDTEKGSTPLMCAVSLYGVTADTPAAVLFLLDHHADVNARDHRGKTALDYAIERSLNNLEQIMCKAGAKTGKELDAQSTTPPKH